MDVFECALLDSTIHGWQSLIFRLHRWAGVGSIFFWRGKGGHEGSMGSKTIFHTQTQRVNSSPKHDRAVPAGSGNSAAVGAEACGRDSLATWMRQMIRAAVVVGHQLLDQCVPAAKNTIVIAAEKHAAR